MVHLSDELIKSIQSSAAWAAWTTSTSTTSTKTQWQEIKESLQNSSERDTTSKSSINKTWKSIKNMASDLWWAAKTLRSDKVSNKDESKWIKDYDRWKYYNNIMQSSDLTDEQHDYMIKSMVDEWVIDEKKYKAYEVKQKEKEAEKEEFTKVKDKHMNDFGNEIDNVLWNYFNKNIDTYTINVLTKAKSELLKQYQMMYEWMMNTYDDTRDDSVLDAWDKDSEQYRQDILQFLNGWAESLTKNWSRYNTAYLDVINQDQYKKLANDLNVIQRNWTWKMDTAAVRSNFKWALNDLTEWKIWSALVGTVVWALNTLNLALDTVVWVPVEELKQWVAGMYDVVEELVSLNVYKETDSALRRWWWTIANWWVEIIDALPQVTQFLIPFTQWWKIEKSTKLIKMANKLPSFTKWVEAVWVSKFAYTAAQLTADVAAYDLAFQQFTSQPLTSQDVITNMIFNLPIDSFLWALSKWAKYFKPNLSREVLTSDSISKELARMIAKGWDGEMDIYKLAEKYYIGKWLEKEWKDVLSIAEIEKTNKALADKIRNVQEKSTEVRDRISAYEWRANDLAIEYSLNNSKRRRKNTPITQQIEQTYQQKELLNWMFNARYETAHLPAIITSNFIAQAVRDGRLTMEQASRYISESFQSKALRNTVEWIIKWTPEWYKMYVQWLEEAIHDVVLNNAWPNYIKDAFNNLMYNILKENPDLVRDWQRFGNFYKTRKWTFKEFIGWDGSEYTLPEVLDMLKRDNVSLLDVEWASLWNRLDDLVQTISNSDNPNQYVNVNKLFTDGNGKVLWWFDPKDWMNISEYQRRLVKDIYAKAWVEFRMNKQWVYEMQISWAKAQELRNSVQKLLWGTNYNRLSESELAAYKVLYAKDYAHYKQWYDLFKSAEKKSQTTWFEDLYEKHLIDWKPVYELKNKFNSDVISHDLWQLFGWWSFIDIEKTAARNIIGKDVENTLWYIKNLKALDWWDLDKWDRAIWNTINNRILGKYRSPEETAIIGNQIFNLIKWMWYTDTDAVKAWEMIAWWFADYLTDPYTVKALAEINNWDLYKAIAARIILSDKEWWEFFRQTLTSVLKPFSDLQENKVAYTTLVDNVERLNSSFNRIEEIKKLKDQVEKQLEQAKKEYANWRVANKETLENPVEFVRKVAEAKDTSLKEQIELRASQIKEWEKQIANMKDNPNAVNLDNKIFLSKVLDAIDLNDRKAFTKQYNKIKWARKNIKSKKNVTWDKWKFWVWYVDDVRYLSDEDINDIATLVAYNSYDKAGFLSRQQADGAAIWLARWITDLRQAALDWEIWVTALRINVNDGKFAFLHPGKKNPQAISLWQIQSARILASLDEPDTYMHYIVNHELTHARQYAQANWSMEAYVDALITDYMEVRNAITQDNWPICWYLMRAIGKDNPDLDDVLWLVKWDKDDLINRLREQYKAWEDWMSMSNAEREMSEQLGKLKELITDAKAYMNVTGKWSDITWAAWLSREDLIRYMDDIKGKWIILDRFKELQLQKTRLSQDEFIKTLNTSYDSKDLVKWLSLPKNTVENVAEKEWTKNKAWELINKVTWYTSNSVDVRTISNSIWSNTTSNIWVKVANTVADLVWDGSQVSKYKVLAWKNVDDAYLDYVAKWGTMSKQNFLLNRYVASVLISHWQYSPRTVAIINAKISNLIDDAFETDLRSAYKWWEGAEKPVRKYVNYLVEIWLIDETVEVWWKQVPTSQAVIDMLKNGTDLHWAKWKAILEKYGWDEITFVPRKYSRWHWDDVSKAGLVDVYDKNGHLLWEDTWVWATDYDLLVQAINTMYTYSKRLNNPSLTEFQHRYVADLFKEIVWQSLDNLWANKRAVVSTTSEETRRMASWIHTKREGRLPEWTPVDKVLTVDTDWADDVIEMISWLENVRKWTNVKDVLWTQGYQKLLNMYRSFQKDISDLSYNTHRKELVSHYELLNKKAYNMIMDILSGNNKLKKTTLDKENIGKLFVAKMNVNEWESMSLMHQLDVANWKHYGNENIQEWSLIDDEFDYVDDDILSNEERNYLSYSNDFDEDSAQEAAEHRITEDPYWENDSINNYIVNEMFDDMRRDYGISYDEDFLIEETPTSLKGFEDDNYNAPIYMDSHIPHGDMKKLQDLINGKVETDDKQTAAIVKAFLEWKTKVDNVADYVNTVGIENAIGKKTKDWVIEYVTLDINKKILSKDNKYYNFTSTQKLDDNLNPLKAINDIIWVFSKDWEISMNIILKDWDKYKTVVKTMKESSFWNSDAARMVLKKLWLPENLWVEWWQKVYVAIANRLRDLVTNTYNKDLKVNDELTKWMLANPQDAKRAFLNVNSMLNEFAWDAFSEWNKIALPKWQPRGSELLDKLQTFVYNSNWRNYVFDWMIPEFIEKTTETSNIRNIQRHKWVWRIYEPVKYTDIQDAKNVMQRNYEAVQKAKSAKKPKEEIDELQKRLDDSIKKYNDLEEERRAYDNRYNVSDDYLPETEEIWDIIYWRRFVSDESGLSEAREEASRQADAWTKLWVQSTIQMSNDNRVLIRVIDKDSWDVIYWQIDIFSPTKNWDYGTYQFTPLKDNVNPLEWSNEWLTKVEVEPESEYSKRVKKEIEEKWNNMSDEEKAKEFERIRKNKQNEVDKKITWMTPDELRERDQLTKWSQAQWKWEKMVSGWHDLTKEQAARLKELDDKYSEWLKNYLKEHEAEAEELFNELSEYRTKKFEWEFKEWTQARAPMWWEEVARWEIEPDRMQFELDTDKTTDRMIVDKDGNRRPYDEVKSKSDKEIIDEQIKFLDLDNPSPTTVIDAPTQKKITNRLMNITNYDVYRDSEDLQQIFWMRVDFLNNYGDRLSDTITRFNEYLSKLTPEENKTILDKVRMNARKKINEWVDKAKWAFEDWLPQEAQWFVKEMVEIFNEAWWKPAIVLSNIDDKKWLSNIINSIVQNHKMTAMQFYNVHTADEVRKALSTNVGMYVKEWQVKNIVSDLMWDPLGTGFFYNLTSTLRWLYRRLKYTYNVLWGTLMFANSAVLGNQRYKYMMSWFEEVMNSKAFNELIDSGWVKSLNRWDDIMINGNTDLWWSLIDVMANKVLDELPLSEENKKIIKTIESWWIHSAYDLMAQWWVKRLALAQALAKQWIDETNIDAFVKALNSGKISKEVKNKILAETEMVYSRFFTNSSSAALSRHRHSRMFMFNNLQWYVINRTDEMTSSIKRAYEWIMKRTHTKTWIDAIDKYRNISFSRREFTDYLNSENLELKSFLCNVLMSAKMWYYYWQAITWQPDTFENFKEYRVDTSDYLSSLDATWFASILSAPFEWYQSYTDYKRMSGEETQLGEWLRAAAINTISEICSRFFKEWKFLTATANTLVAYWQTWDLDFAWTVLWTEIEKMMTWLWRFQLSDVDDTYDMEDFSSDTDIIGKILLTNHETSQAGKLKTKINSLEAAERAIDNPELAFITAVWYLPVIWQFIKSATNMGWFTFNEAVYKEYREMVRNDPVMNWLYHWEISIDDFSDNGIQQLYYELTDFDYTREKLWENGRHLVWSYDGNSWEDYTIKSEKEEVFVRNMLTELWISDAEWRQKMNDAKLWKKDWIIKLMAMAEAYQPGSGKTILSYLANQEAYEYLQKATWNKYPSWNDIDDETNKAIQALVVEKYYPELFICDKTSRYRAIQVYLNDANPDVFNSLYKDQKLSKFTNTLWYMDMLMHQMAYEWEVDAAYIKNVWWMIGKYVDDDAARMTLINYTLSSIDKLDWLTESQKLKAKESLLAGNMDFIWHIKNDEIANMLHEDSIKEYENFVWWVKKELGLQLKDKLWDWTSWTWYKYKKNPYKKYKYNYPNYNYWTGAGDWNGDWVDKAFYKWANKLLDPFNNVSPDRTYTSPRRPMRTEMTNVDDDFKFYLKVYEDHVKAYSDKLVGEWTNKNKGNQNGRKTYDWQYKYGEWIRNRGYINPARLTFPRHKQPAYSTKVLSNLPGASG